MATDAGDLHDPDPPPKWDNGELDPLLDAMQAATERRKLRPGHPRVRRAQAALAAAVGAKDMAACRSAAAEVLAAIEATPEGRYDWTVKVEPRPNGDVVT